MPDAVFAVSSIVLTLLLFGLRQVLLRMARNIAHCSALLQHATSEDKSALPRRIKHGKMMPVFRANDMVLGHPIVLKDLFGTSTIIVFFRLLEYERCPLDMLLVFFRSWWYHVDGNIYVILMDSFRDSIKKIPHSDLFNTDVGQDIVLGVSNERELVRTLGLTKTPTAVELDAKGIVRRVVFFGNQDWQREIDHG